MRQNRQPNRNAKTEGLTMGEPRLDNLRDRERWILRPRAQGSRQPKVQRARSRPPRVVSKTCNQTEAHAASLARKNLRDRSACLTPLAISRSGLTRSAHRRFHTPSRFSLPNTLDMLNLILLEVTHLDYQSRPCPSSRQQLAASSIRPRSGPPGSPSLVTGLPWRLAVPWGLREGRTRASPLVSSPRWRGHR